MPILVHREIIVAGVLAGRGIAWRAVAVVWPVTVILAVALYPVGPGGSDYEYHHLLVLCGRSFGNEFQPVRAVWVQRQQCVHAVLSFLREVLISDGGHNHM